MSVFPSPDVPTCAEPHDSNRRGFAKPQDLRRHGKIYLLFYKKLCEFSVNKRSNKIFVS